jgi:AraC family transcriptional regulator
MSHSLSPEQIRRVCDYIHAHLNSDMEVADLARQVNLSAHHFSMLFKQAIGVPPHQYVLHRRIDEAQRQLAAGRMTLSEVALSLGFSDQSHFSRAFRKITGTTPTRYAGRWRASPCQSSRPLTLKSSCSG